MDVNSSFVHPSSIVDDGAVIGAHTKIWHFCHVSGGCVIGEHCSFGQGVYIAPGVKVGNCVRVQNGVNLYAGVVLEDYCFVGPNAVFTNDKYPRACGPWKCEPTILRRGASVGANATILCGVTLGEFSMVGCGSVVTKSIPDRALVQGNPARVVRYCSWKELELKFEFLKGEKHE